MEFTPRYTFSLCIKQDGKVLIETEVRAGDTQEDIIRAKKTIQRLLNEYNPADRMPKPTSEMPEPEVTAPPPYKK